MGLDPMTGYLAGTTVGDVTSTITRNGFGEPIAAVYEFQGTPVYELAYGIDSIGRVETKTEVVLGTTTTRCYVYDLAGRLARVFDDHDGAGCTGAMIEEYRYDANSNRVYALNSGGLVAETDVLVDAQDRMLEHGTLRFAYSENGEVAIKEDTATGDAWVFHHDAIGNVTGVELPSGALLEYVVDARNRRVGRKLDGVLTHGFLYGEHLNPVAQLDGAGDVTARFVYASRGHVPDYMVTASGIYRLISDDLGSVVLVIDTSTGMVAQHREYDSWGRVLLDTNPGFQPFGFAGGLWDEATGLVRFGVRDYEPEIGRWMAKDPSLFEGRDPNLYGYVTAAPTSFIDPLGLKTWRCSRPLGGSPGTPGQHEYACVEHPDGTIECGSQTATSGKGGYFFPVPGRPTRPDEDYYHPGSCDLVEDDGNSCVESCMAGGWAQPRPDYAVGPFGTDCQEYTDDLLNDCFEQCWIFFENYG